MTVVDASAILEVLLQSPAASRVESRLFRAGETLHAPHLLDLEIAQVLRRYAAWKQLSESRAREAIQGLTDFPLTRYPHLVLLPRIWALRADLSAYDAAYVALAEALNAPLVTRDARMGKAPGHGARIEVV